ncbi:MAG: Csp1 family four helix bundle copper storage protein [Myxococcota bacterium]
MKRRDWMSVGAAVAGAQLAGTALSSCGAQGGGESPPEPAQSAGAEADTSALDEWARVAAECHRVGERCLEHCIRLLGNGNTAMADCARTVNEMLPVCAAVGPLAAARSQHARQLAALCKAVCESCLAACEAHRSHHAECAACADACEATIAASNRVLS